MVSVDILSRNLLAALLVWGWVLTAGFPLGRLLRIPLGVAGSVLLGMAYWSVVLYLLPFRHGLDAAAGLALLALAVAIRLRPFPVNPFARRPTRASAILILGCGAFGTLLLTQYVPPGMDASMHTTAARLIAENAGLPKTYAPILPRLSFPAINLGLPTIAATAIRCGCTPTSAMLAAEQLAFSAFVLATFAVLRLCTSATPAAILAVFAVWASRNAQETVGWGGVPTVAGVALGLFALRLLIDLGARPAYRVSIPLGLTIAAIPLVHGVSAGVWIYAVAPVAVALALSRTPDRRRCLACLTAAGSIAGLSLAAYRVFGHTTVGEQEIAWAREWVAGFAPTGTGWQMLLSVPAYIVSFAGSAAIWPGILAAGVLLVRRRIGALLALSAFGLLLCLVVANSRVWVLPFSFLLYPERAVYWATPLAAAAMALAWKSLGIRLRQSPLLGFLVLGVLVPIAMARHHHGFQRIAFQPRVSKAEWDALQWAGQHLEGENTLVSAAYNSTGSYLPAVAGIASTGWHAHFTVMNEARPYLTCPPTHTFLVRSLSAQEIPEGEIVFENDRVVLIAHSRLYVQPTGRPSR